MMDELSPKTHVECKGSTRMFFNARNFHKVSKFSLNAFVTTEQHFTISLSTIELEFSIWRIIKSWLSSPLNSSPRGILVGNNYFRFLIQGEYFLRSFLEKNPFCVFFGWNFLQRMREMCSWHKFFLGCSKRKNYYGAIKQWSLMIFSGDLVVDFMMISWRDLIRFEESLKEIFLILKYFLDQSCLKIIKYFESIVFINKFLQ